MSNDNRISAHEARHLLAKSKPKASKYRNLRTKLADGSVADSAKEARHIETVRMLERQGLATNVETQVRYPLIVNGHKIATYVLDVRWFDVTANRWRREDVKSPPTRANRTYILKKKLVRAIHGFEIEEV